MDPPEAGKQNLQDILFLFSLLSPDLRDRLLKVMKNNLALPEKNKSDTKFGVA